ncbi:DUF4232 domain-containing protein [Streptomyces avicenniae]|uniref:DUF4232 domain-containing protein n=1 Tax=Streptomyces avicenniae TaxID=500153 RepID=UPI000699E30B|nr:DUF4232 domain-containing protein [Streptomyces avicenniae]
MNTHAPHRRTRLRAAVAVLGATLALTLTACQEDELSGAAPSESPTVESPQEEDGGGDADTAGDAGGTGDTGDTGQDGGTGQGDDAEEDTGVDPGQGTLEGGAGESEEDTVPCTDTTTELVATPVERPINHMLLTVTNTGSETCFAWYSPFLRFDGAQAPVARIESSAPQSVVGLAPGETAYAAIITSDASGEAQGGYTATGLDVQFAGADGDGVGAPVAVELPGGEVYIDSAAQVTYWQTTLDQALHG